MQIPSVFYGRAAQASSRIRGLAKKLVQTRDFATYDPGPLLDTADVGGLVLFSPEFVRSSHENFHCYLLSEYLVDASEPCDVHATLHEWLMASLDVEWRFLCTIGGLSSTGLEGRGPDVARRYVEAAVRHWPRIAEERRRFGPLLEDRDILDHWYTLFSALKVLGLSPKDRMSLPNRDPAALLEYIDRGRFK